MSGYEELRQRQVADLAGRMPEHMESFPVDLPIDEIVAGLNGLQPVTLVGYASVLVRLAAEARSGRLEIGPKRIITTSEPLLPHDRRSIQDALGAPVANLWASSEAGPMAVGCWRSPGMHLCEDLGIIEPVDAQGRPVPPGVRSDMVYATVLSNPTLPMIRLELSDQVTVLGDRCPCGSAHRLVADVAGRAEDSFTYPDGVVVHPHLFRSVILREPSVVEYQVAQTPTGVDVRLVGAPTDPGSIARAIAAGLADAGLPDPSVNVHIVDALQRQATGKVRRFISLAA